MVVRPRDGLHPAYAVSVFRTPAYTQEVDNSSRGIVKDRNRLYWDEFKSTKGTPIGP